MLIDVRVRYDGMNSTTRQAMIFIQEIAPVVEEEPIIFDEDLDEQTVFDWMFWLMILDGAIVGFIIWKKEK
jgi:hypothetical protein